MTVLRKVFADLLIFLEAEKELQKQLLECEETTSKIARIQGFLVGANTYKDTLAKAEIQVAIADNSGFTGHFSVKKYGFYELKDCNTYLDGLKNLDEYKEFEDLRKAEIERMKNFLFFESEKSRDLHFCKGWFDGIMKVDEYTKELKKELERRKKERDESLPFEENERQLA